MIDLHGPIQYGSKTSMMNKWKEIAESKKEYYFEPLGQPVDPDDDPIDNVPFYARVFAQGGDRLDLEVTRDADRPWLKKGHHVWLEVEDFWYTRITKVQD